MRQQLLDKDQSFQERPSPPCELTENKERDGEDVSGKGEGQRAGRG